MTTDYLTARPAADEHGEYYGRYIQRVPEGDILDLLTQQIAGTLALVSGLSDTQARYRPGPAEWSIKEVLGHVIDTERIFAYRGLCVARGDKTPLPGFEQDDYVRAATFDDYPLADLIEEFKLVRQTTVLLFRHLTPGTWERRGTASGFPLSARAAVYIIAGHERHHEESLRTSYGLK